jgi:hypothetical protein
MRERDRQAPNPLISAAFAALAAASSAAAAPVDCRTVPPVMLAGVPASLPAPDRLTYACVLSRNQAAACPPGSPAAAAAAARCLTDLEVRIQEVAAALKAEGGDRRLTVAPEPAPARLWDEDPPRNLTAAAARVAALAPNDPAPRPLLDRARALRAEVERLAAAPRPAFPPGPCATSQACVQSCDAGDLDACVRLGDKYERRDFERALAAWREACDAGHPDGCKRVARIFARASLATRRDSDATLTIRYLRRACALGDQPTCDALRPALDALRRGCADGERSSCRALEESQR